MLKSTFTKLEMCRLRFSIFGTEEVRVVGELHLTLQLFAQNVVYAILMPEHRKTLPKVCRRAIRNGNYCPQ